ncbi:MAG: Asp-tRNA(Asn)/Glu-tRNA(Gln) amidotransferase subunit GatA [Patescibacteria group bacterium]|nr:Asp-tRNA(Asn)/Glu-tRNA(Gln) amidotransferase subunit GatA [Patescibacteria group bacterium]
MQNLEITNLSALELAEKIRNKEITAVEAVTAYLNVTEKKDKDINAFITVCHKEALAAAQEIDAKIAKKKKLGLLAGVPYAAKDIFATAGIESTGGSRILKGYKPPADATAIARLKEAGAILIGKTNCDEFAMGASGEHSAYGATKNPHNLKCVSGGSSSGSAAAVAANMCAFAIGTDTGGSIRQPAALCGVVGLKVTYGRISRAGVFPLASSIDTIGPLTKNVCDAALVLGVLAGQDKYDHTTLAAEVPNYLKSINKSSALSESKKKPLQNIKIGLPKECFESKISADIRDNVNKVIVNLEKLGAKVSECSLPYMKYSIPVYYIVVPSEASANLERFDGIRFGLTSDDDSSLIDFYIKNRSKGFGDEVKRRIMIGTYTLSAGYYDAYYKKAMQVRTLICEDFKKAFTKFDALIMPTTPNTAWEIGKKLNDPLSEYLEDMFTAPANLAGLPAISIPSGFGQNKLPLGIQFIGPQFGEEIVFKIGSVYELSKS